MKAVLIAVAGLLAIGVHAQTSCPTPTYTEDIVPKCLTDKRVKLPSYADPYSYYDCSTGTAKLTKCETGIFTYVYQQCTTCAQYIPAPDCSALKLGLTCTPIADGPTTATTPEVTVITDTSTAVTKTTKSTATPTGSTTPSPPAPPSDSTAASGTSTPITDDGTTIYVPPPPGPADPNVPQPSSPSPTVGTFPTGPP
ncbi:peritrophin-55 [Drosophila grimshawi]|uniref:GH22098 n=1 Tax=Drosophila grimshawi TaxID=7222 RepID=B4JS78_DROGR|nr:peritrophin-55 [Drosophila grimshawi]EDV94618.1 GH22098 [Drosophila grimshawi]